MTGDGTPRHRLPTQEQWNAFCDLLDSAAPWLEARGPSPDPALSAEQFAVGLLVSAVEHLLISTNQPEPFILVAQRLGTAWEHMRTGVPDPLLMNRASAGRPGPEQAMAWFRAEILRLLDEVAPPASGRQRQASLEIQRALRRARAPKRHVPDAQTIRNWHASAANPGTPADRLLAEVRQSIERSVPEGETVDERVRWILGVQSRSVMVQTHP